MLVNDREAVERLNSPDNLINRLRNLNVKKDKGSSSSSSSLDIFKKPAFVNPFQVKKEEKKEEASNEETSQASETANSPSIDHLIDDSENQIKLAAAHNTALAVLNSAIQEMAIRIPEIKADKLPAVITATSRVVEGIRKERSEAAKKRENNSVHFHFYTPQQKQLNDYEVIEIN